MYVKDGVTYASGDEYADMLCARGEAEMYAQSDAIAGYELALAQATAMIEQKEKEIARLRDENESLRGSLEEWKLDLNSLRDENAKLSALLLWALYHHQGGSSEVGQPIRRALGIGQYDHLTPSQIEMAKSAAIAQEDK